MKKTLKGRRVLLSVAAIVLTIASIFAIGAISANAATDSGDIYSFTSTRYYEMQKPLPTFSSYTFETEFYLPADFGNGRAYNLIANWADSGRDGNEWNIELHNYGSVRLMHTTYGSVYFGTNTESNPKETDVRTYMTDENGNPTYARMTITVDTENGNAYLYMNGEEVSRVENSSVLKGKTYVASANYKHRIGRDYRNDKSSYFKGSIKNMAMYSYVRTADEVAAAAKAFSPDLDDARLMFAYDFNTLRANGGYLTDLSKNNYTAINPQWDAESDGKGRTFTANEMLLLTKDLTVMPNTFEAVVYAPTAQGRPGIIFGNYHGNEAALNFELHNSGAATIHYDPDYSTAASSTKIADVRNDSGYVHIAIVRTGAASGGKYALYVDGKLVKETTLSVDKGDLDMEEVQKIYKFCLGGDHRGSNKQYYQGRIKNVALYSTSFTAEQVMSSYRNGVGTVDSGLILNYDMTVVENKKYEEDLSGNGHHMTLNGVPYESFFIGRDFDEDDELYFEKGLSAQPMTYEAVVMAPSAIDRTGVIVGNYGSGSTSLINFEIYSGGRPSVYIKTENGDLMETKFDYKVNNDEWAHIVITHELLPLGGARFTCYVNGEKVDSFDTDASYKLEDISSLTSLAMGRDSRSGNTQYYKGRIKNVALYSEVLTEQQIRESYENGVNTANESLMAYYELQGTDDADLIKDKTENGYDLHSLFYANQKPLTLGKDYAYSMAIVGDTQKLVLNDANNGTDYTSYIYKWLVNNKEEKNIQFVMGLGDITDKNLDTEWTNIVSQFKRLEDAKLAYSLVQGNHDTVAKLDTYFKDNPNFTKADIGYYSGNSLGNYYMRFNAGGHDYMVIVLQYGPNNSILDWAGDVIAANPDRKVIITTHAYMYRDGTTLDINDVVPPRTFDEKTDPDSTDAATREKYNNNGDQIWIKLASQYENVVMVLSGHDPCASVVMRQDTGIHGNTVTQFLIDFQGMDTTYNYETGMVAMFYFSADGKQVKVEYISTYNSIEAENKDSNAADVIYNASVNQFEFSIPDTVAPSSAEVTINGVGGYIVEAKYSNPITYPFVVFKSDKTFIGGYGDLGAATNAAKSEGLSGDYLILMRRNAEQNIKAGGCGNVTGSITLDLGGYTLYKTSVGYIFDIYVNDNSSASVNEQGIDVRGSFCIDNGTIISYSSGLPLIGVNYGASLKKSYSVSLEFNRVTFIDKLGGYNIFGAWENGYTSLTGDKKVLVDATFNDCVFDYKSSVDGTKMIHLVNADGYDRVIYNTKINGGNIITASKDVLSGFAELDGNNNGRADSLTYGKSEGGNYLTVTVIGDSELPVLDANEGELVLVKIAENGDSIVYRLMPKEAAELSFVPKASITLGSELVFNIYVPATPNLTKLTLDGLELDPDLLTEKEGYYVIHTPLAASVAARTLTLVAALDVDGRTFTGTFTFSIPGYAEKVLAATDTTAGEKMLVCDVLSYIRAAYAYFGTEDAAAIAVINELLGDKYDEISAPVMNGSAVKPTLGITAVTYNLTAKPAVRFYISDSLTKSDFTFSVNGEVVESKEGSDKNGRYLEINLYAYRMAETVEYTVAGATDSCHISCYYEWAKEQNDDALVLLVERFAKYCESAAAYYNAVTA